MKKNWKIKTISELTTLQYEIVINSATEPPFKNKYWDNNEKGIYVDILSGEPLFSSSDKYNSGYGWPSFTKPVDETALIKKNDSTLMLQRTEVRTKITDIHLGHVFNGNSQKKGSLHYCINSAALRFIPLSEMVKEGYEEYLFYIKPT